MTTVFRVPWIIQRELKTSAWLPPDNAVVWFSALDCDPLRLFVCQFSSIVSHPNTFNRLRWRSDQSLNNGYVSGELFTLSHGVFTPFYTSNGVVKSYSHVILSWKATAVGSVTITTSGAGTNWKIGGTDTEPIRGNFFWSWPSIFWL